MVWYDMKYEVWYILYVVCYAILCYAMLWYDIKWYHDMMWWDKIWCDKIYMICDIWIMFVPYSIYSFLCVNTIYTQCLLPLLHFNMVHNMQGRHALDIPFPCSILQHPRHPTPIEVPKFGDHSFPPKNGGGNHHLRTILFRVRHNCWKPENPGFSRENWPAGSPASKALDEALGLPAPREVKLNGLGWCWMDRRKKTGARAAW